MADVLPSLQKLRVINFGDCLVRPEGAQAIATAIKDSHKQLEVRGEADVIPLMVLLLQEISLSYGELDQDAGLMVARALANKTALQRIDLNGTV